VRIVQHVRESVTDLGGLALAGYLVSKNAVSGANALLFALALLLPSPVLLRLAKVIGARGGSSGAGVAVALLTASAAYSKIKAIGIATIGVAGIAACVSGCAGAAPSLSPIAPHVVHREEYGTCVESGGKLEVPQGPTFAMITQACMLMDAGSSATSGPSDASVAPPRAREDGAEVGGDG
jgi:hypothetical protein